MPDPHQHADFERLSRECDDEFARYEKHRAELVKQQLEGEKSYDTLLVSLATLAIGSSFTLLKDVTRGSAGWFFVAAWVSLGICLFAALIDRLLTFEAHKNTRRLFDDRFGKWAETRVGTWEQATADALKLWHNVVLPPLKWLCLATLLVGVVLLMIAVYVGWSDALLGGRPATMPTTTTA